MNIPHDNIPCKSNKEGFTFFNGLPVVLSTEQVNAFSDYSSFCKVVESAGSDLTRGDCEWIQRMCIHYLAFLAEIVDQYLADSARGKRKGHTARWWEIHLRNLPEAEQNAEHMRICTLIETEIVPWLNRQQKEVAR